MRQPWRCLILLTSLSSIICISCNKKNKLKPLIHTHQDSINQQKLITRAYAVIDSIKKTIQSGDLITRTGKDFTSQSLRSLNQRNKTYSHCGIASIENDTVFIYHALGGEWNPDEKVRRDPFELFAEPYSNKGIGIFSFKIDDSSRIKSVKTAQQFYKKGLMFDMKFDLNTDDRMYCAEFIYKTFLIASNHKLVFNISNIGEFNFIGVDDIFMQPLCKMKNEILYN